MPDPNPRPGLIHRLRTWLLNLLPAKPPPFDYNTWARNQPDYCPRCTNFHTTIDCHPNLTEPVPVVYLDKNKQTHEVDHDD